MAERRTDRQTDRAGVMRLAHLGVVRAGVVEVADLWHADEQVIRQTFPIFTYLLT